MAGVLLGDMTKSKISRGKRKSFQKGLSSGTRSPIIRGNIQASAHVSLAVKRA